MQQALVFRVTCCYFSRSQRGQYRSKETGPDLLERRVPIFEANLQEPTLTLPILLACYDKVEPLEAPRGRSTMEAKSEPQLTRSTVRRKRGGAEIPLCRCCAW